MSEVKTWADVTANAIIHGIYGAAACIILSALDAPTWFIVGVALLILK